VGHAERLRRGQARPFDFDAPIVFSLLRSGKRAASEALPISPTPTLLPNVVFGSLIASPAYPPYGIIIPKFLHNAYQAKPVFRR
jgi:hypothetical protein